MRTFFWVPLLLVFTSACLLLVDEPEFVDDEQELGPGLGPGLEPAPTSGWLDVDTSGRMCALHQDSSLWCGEFDSLRRVAGSYQALANDCAVLTDGTLVCGFRDDPPTFELPGPFVAVDGSSSAGCALLASGSAHCWPEADNVDGPFDSIGAGDTFACGIRSGSGELSCWSIDNVILDEALTNVPSGSFKYVDTNDHVGCGVRLDGSMSCWGYDLSNGLISPPAGSYTEVSIDTFYACGARSDASAVCWGDDVVPANPHTFPPTDVILRTISTGYDSACGVTIDSTLECWGNI